MFDSYSRWMSHVAWLALLFVAPLAEGRQILLDVAMGEPVVLAGKKNVAYLRVAMTGIERENEGDRPPVNVAIVLDKSGSMQGEKIEQAKRAAWLAVQRLGTNDIVSVIAYDSDVEVLLPATKVSNRESIHRAIQQLTPGGSTALHAGVSEGASELRKFLDKKRVNRVVLLSDGIANVGPSSTADLAKLGAELVEEGISVSTIGLGLQYNEDLMLQLAQASDGNHIFAENGRDLEVAFTEEFGDVLTVAAQDVDVRIHCKDDVRPVRVLGREASVSGQEVAVSLNQVYSGQMKYVLLELELPPGGKGDERSVAVVEVSYAPMNGERKEKLRRSVAVTYTDAPEKVKEETNKGVMVAMAREIGAENSRTIIKLRDEGKIEEAKEVIGKNQVWLEENLRLYPSRPLEVDAKRNGSITIRFEGEDWKRQKKVMQVQQNEITKQQKTIIKK